MPTRLPIRIVVEKKAAVEEPVSGLLEESSRSGYQLDHIEVQDVKEERNASIGFQDRAKPTPESDYTDAHVPAPEIRRQQNTYGTETEVTTGLRAQGFPGRHIDYDATGTLQRGSYSNDSIHAGSASLKARYMASSLPWRPHLLGEYDYATGNAHRDPQRIGTFDQQYPSNHNAFGLVDLFGFQNMKQRRLNLDLEPCQHLTLLFQAESLHATTRADGIYNSAGALFVKAPSVGFTSDNIGTGFDASAKYVYHKYLVVQAGAGHFFPGEIMTHNGQGSPLTISWLELTYRFKAK